MNDRIVRWRLMCFEPEGDQLLSSLDLGEASIKEVQAAIQPDDSQEMCGSYPLTDLKVEWIRAKFGMKLPIAASSDLYLERDS